MNPQLKTAMMDWNGCSWVESVPDRMHGLPVLLHTRMDADGVLINFDEGLNVSEICAEFGLTEEAVVGVLGFAGRLAQRSAA